MIDLVKLLVKSYIARVRWGALTEYEENLVWDASLSKILRASYITHNAFSPTNIVTLDQ